MPRDQSSHGNLPSGDASLKSLPISAGSSAVHVGHRSAAARFGRHVRRRGHRGRRLPLVPAPRTKAAGTAPCSAGIVPAGHSARRGRQASRNKLSRFTHSPHASIGTNLCGCRNTNNNNVNTVWSSGVTRGVISRPCCRGSRYGSHLVLLPCTRRGLECPAQLACTSGGASPSPALWW